MCPLYCNYAGIVFFPSFIRERRAKEGREGSHPSLEGSQKVWKIACAL